MAATTIDINQPEFKLIYFNLRGRAELPRMLFSLGKQAYEDKRIELKDWPAMKKETTFGALPVLEVTENNETTVIAQSISISRYLANRFGLAGKTDLERAQCDMIVDQISDTLTKIIQIYIENDGAEKEEKLNEALKKAAQETVPNSLSGIEKLLERNNQKNGNSGFLVGNSLTYADLFMVVFYDFTRDDKQVVLAKLPLLKQHDAKIRNIPEVADHIARNAHVRVSIKF